MSTRSSIGMKAAEGLVHFLPPPQTCKSKCCNVRDEDY